MRDRRRRLSAAILSGTLLATVLAATPASAAAFTFNELYYGSNCWSGRGAANTVHTFRLLDGTTPVTSTRVTSESDGSFYACFIGNWELVYGYKLEAKSGTTTRTLTIPNLSVKTDRTEDVVFGKAPPGKKVRVTVTAYGPGDYVNNMTFNHVLTANASGNWSKDYTGFDGIRGGDSVNLYYKQNQDYSGTTGDVWRLSTSVEYMHLYRGSSEVWGTVNVGEAVTITLKTSANVVRATAPTGAYDYDGDFSAFFRNSRGAVVLPRATDKVSATFASDANLTIPNITVVGNASTNVVSGTCMASQGFYVYARKPNYSDSASRYGMTNSSGAFSVNIGAEMNLVAGDYISVECKYDSGDEIQREGVAG